jgi:hypothetical protein
LDNISIQEIMLTCHPSTPPFMADSIDVAVKLREDGTLWLRYYLECELNSLDLPDTVEPERTHGLWQTTCFELFVCKADTEAYLEYNFSPSNRWAAYRFNSYREGMAEQMTYRPQLYGDASESHYALEAELELPAEWRDGPLLIGLCAVVAETDGTKSYWALAHPPGKPDFHHKDCFALKLEAPRGA